MLNILHESRDHFIGLITRRIDPNTSQGEKNVCNLEKRLFFPEITTITSCVPKDIGRSIIDSDYIQYFIFNYKRKIVKKRMMDKSNGARKMTHFQDPKSREMRHFFVKFSIEKPLCRCQSFHYR